MIILNYTYNNKNKRHHTLYSLCAGEKVSRFPLKSSVSTESRFEPCDWICFCSVRCSEDSCKTNFSGGICGKLSTLGNKILDSLHFLLGELSTFPRFGFWFWFWSTVAWKTSNLAKGFVKVIFLCAGEGVDFVGGVTRSSWNSFSRDVVGDSCGFDWALKSSIFFWAEPSCDFDALLLSCARIRFASRTFFLFSSSLSKYSPLFSARIWSYSLSIP